MPSGKVLIVEDDKDSARMCTEIFGTTGLSTKSVESAEEGLRQLEQSPGEFGLVLTDIRLEGMNGLELLKKIRERYGDMPVIVMTGFATVKNAVEALRSGASDYITKPFEPADLVMTAKRLLRMKGLEEEVDRLRSEVGAMYDMGRIIGRSESMSQVFKMIESVSDSDVNVLIQGETGTGKELVARAIHYNSPRKHGPFVKVDCGALTGSLLESELFGHEKGAFTGAVRNRPGRFRAANGGSIFLDEIANVPLPLQAKLLRALEDSEFEPVGSDRTVRVDVRAIAATNASLSDSVKDGSFRADLYYRLQVVTVQLPPLRERREDVPLLVEHFLETFRDKDHRPVRKLEKAAMHKLLSYDWPGNVRELENVLQRAVILSKDSVIRPADITVSPGREEADELPADPSLSLKEQVLHLEAKLIKKALDDCGGDRSAAAKTLGISRATLYNKLKQVHSVLGKDVAGSA